MTKPKPKHLHKRRGPAPKTGISPRVSVRLPADWLAAIDAMPGESRSEKLQAVIRLGLDVAQRRAKK